MTAITLVLTVITPTLGVGDVGLLYGQNANEFYLRAEPRYSRLIPLKRDKLEYTCGFQVYTHANKFACYRHNSQGSLWAM